MLATDFGRRDCQVGKRRRTYETLKREWCCVCGARLAERWHEVSETHPQNWGVDCGAGCEDYDFIHENKVARQRSEAIEVLAGLPPEMQELLQPERAQIPERPPGIFSLSAIEPEDF